MAGVSAGSCVIGIAGELVKGTTITVRFRRSNADKELDIAEVEKIIGMVQERAEKRAKKQMSIELGGKELDVRLVNSALVRIEIDGYPVTNPVGFRGREVMVQLYTAFAPMIHIGALERTATELDLTLLAVAAEPFAVSRSVIGNDPNADMSAILMDVGGGTTDIAVLNNGGVQGTKMFGIGGRAYTQSVSKDLSIDFATAESLKMGLKDGRTPTQKREDVETALKKTLGIWTTGVEIALGEFTGLDHLPHRILLCGGGSSLQLLLDNLQQSNWYNELPFTRKPVLQYIQPEQVEGIVDKTGKVTDHTYITAMGLLRVAMDTLAQQDQSRPPRSLQERISKLLSV
jgi:cell division protein FtsA